MKSCAALNCGEKRKRGVKVSFHVFPRDPCLRRQWEAAVGRGNLPKVPFLCSKHFAEDCFDARKPGVLRKLKEGAVPLIFPERPEPVGEEDPLASDVKVKDVPPMEMRESIEDCGQSRECNTNKYQIYPKDFEEEGCITYMNRDVGTAKRLKPGVVSSEHLTSVEQQEKDGSALNCIQSQTSTSDGFMHAFEDWIHRTGSSKKRTRVHSRPVPCVNPNAMRMKPDDILSHISGPTSLEEFDDRGFTSSSPQTSIRPSTTLDGTATRLQLDTKISHYSGPITVQREDSTAPNCTSSRTAAQPLDSSRIHDEQICAVRTIKSPESDSPILHSMLLDSHVEPMLPSTRRNDSEPRFLPCAERRSTEAHERVAFRGASTTLRRNSCNNSGNSSAENVQLRRRVTDLEAKCATIKMEMRIMNKQLRYYKSREAPQETVEKQVRKVLRGFLSDNQLDLLLNKTRKVWWTSEEIATALTIRHMSEQCYIFLRDSLHYPLPALSSLRRWASDYDLRKDILEKK